MSLGGRSPDPDLPAAAAVLAEDSQRWLLASARDALARAMGLPGQPLPAAPQDPRLDEPTRVFVSWHEGEELVGCIGTLVSDRPLREGVRHFAVQSGLHDHRTPMPTAQDLPRLHCEISVLSDPEPMEEQGLRAITDALVPGRDGLVLRDGAKRAVFLPVVWESLPTAQSFVDALCRKAGIDTRRRAEHVRGERFFAQKFGDHPG